MCIYIYICIYIYSHQNIVYIYISQRFLAGFKMFRIDSCSQFIGIMIPAPRMVNKHHGNGDGLMGILMDIAGTKCTGQCGGCQPDEYTPDRIKDRIPCQHTYGDFLKWGYPQIIHRSIDSVFLKINHPFFFGTPIYGTPHMYFFYTTYSGSVTVSSNDLMMSQVDVWLKIGD